jgi:hypothetical protein
LELCGNPALVALKCWVYQSSLRAELHEIRRDDPNCSLFIFVFVNREKIDEFEAAELLAAASKNEGICGLCDNSKIEKFLK